MVIYIINYLLQFFNVKIYSDLVDIVIIARP